MGAGGNQLVLYCRSVPPADVTMVHLPFVWAFVLLVCHGAESRLAFLGIGDWGAGTSRQKQVAGSMGTWAKANKPAFVVTMGDNFYPDGVSSTRDSQFSSKWKNMYTHSSIR